MLVFQFAIFWIVCGVLSYGILLAFFQREFECIAKASYASDRTICAYLSLTGPIFLMLVAIECAPSKHGLKFK